MCIAQSLKGFNNVDKTFCLRFKQFLKGIQQHMHPNGMKLENTLKWNEKIENEMHHKLILSMVYFVPSIF